MAKPLPIAYSGFPVVALVDDADYDRLAQYDWRYWHGGAVDYAYTYAPDYVRMHRLVMGAAADEHVHHRNQDGLDNRRENLRACTPGEHRGIPHVHVTVLERQGRTWDDPRGYRHIISDERRPFQEIAVAQRQAARHATPRPEGATDG